MGIIEFSLAFNAQLSLNYRLRTRPSWPLKPEILGAGLRDSSQRRTGHQCPASATRVSAVDIFWANADGSVNGTNVNSYTRTGSTTCTFSDGSQVTVPYTATAAGYPTSSRCAIIKGCGGSHTGLDNIGVKVTYAHPLSTPAAKFFGANPTITMVIANSMRMEPVL